MIWKKIKKGERLKGNACGRLRLRLRLRKPYTLYLAPYTLNFNPTNPMNPMNPSFPTNCEKGNIF
jgi:hypothetical protein